MKIDFLDKKLGPKFQAGAKRYADIAAKASTSAAYEAARDIKKFGSADIRSAGRFGSRWTTGLHADVSPPRGQSSIDASIKISHKVPYFNIFEFGGTIHGKPLLWIPLSFANDAQGKRARDYPGKLFRVDRDGKAPLLLSSGSGEPKYFGKSEVHMPRKFHIRDIGRKAARNLRTLYNKYFSLYKK